MSSTDKPLAAALAELEGFAMPARRDDAAIAAGLPALVQHHVALAQPKRLLVLGAGDILPLLGHDPAQSSPGVHSLAALAMHRPVLASFAPGALLARWQLRR